MTKSEDDQEDLMLLYDPLSIEAETSAKLYHARTGHHRHRGLSHGPPPPIQETTQHGMMIDAGSQGSRLHVYEFSPRILEHSHDIRLAVRGEKLSVPTTDTAWTDRLQPGLDSFAYILDDDDMLAQVAAYLDPLMHFATTILSEKKENWGSYPIYLKATGGLRTLPRPYRIRLIKAVRQLFQDEKFNPFYFRDEHARVISGEEEAIYGWTAVNFVKGTLIPNSEGAGSVRRANLTYGVLEMGGASTQIGFFEPEGDVMANLFKLQIGAAKHWNVYCHSFLYFGVNGAFDRLNARLYMEATTAHGNTTALPPTDLYNPCLPGGGQYIFTSRVHILPDGTLLPLSSPDDPSVLEADMYSAMMRNTNSHGDFDQCMRRVKQLLRIDANSWCNFAHDRDCSFAGIYQPPLPVNRHDFGEFIATSNFFNVFDFLELPSRSSLAEVEDGARRICSFSMGELIGFNAVRASPIKDPKALMEMCFRASFVASFLVDGAGFPRDYKVTAVDVINGQKVGWALGSMLYEINTLPWEFTDHSIKKAEKLSPKHDQQTLMLGAQFMRNRLSGGGDNGSGNFEVIAGLVVLAIACIGLMGVFKLPWIRQQDHPENRRITSSNEATARMHTEYGTRGIPGEQD